MTNNQGKIVLFRKRLTVAGGAEKLMLEEAKYFQQRGLEVHVLTTEYRKEVLDNWTNGIIVECVGRTVNSTSLFTKVASELTNFWKIRRKLASLKADYILLSSPEDCAFFYLYTLFCTYKYSTHVHLSLFWFQNNLLKYAYIHRRALNKVKKGPFHKDCMEEKLPEITLLKRVKNEIKAIFMYSGIRKAQKIFVLTKTMKSEIDITYHKNSIVLAGAFPQDILQYKAKRDIKAELGLGSRKIILNINRLELRKRVDLIIKAFALVAKINPNVILLIGGTGEEKDNLHNLVQKLRLSDKVLFQGFIDQNILWDYYCCCDVYVHAGWATYDITPLEALALNKIVVVPNEMEFEDSVVNNGNIFFAKSSDVEDFANCIEKALNSRADKNNDVSIYTWEKYCEGILQHLRCPMNLH